MPFFRSIYFCFLVLFFIPVSKLSAQKLKFEKLGISEGLPSTEVYNLYQDKKGYVWAFTEYGIVKHNGVEFITVCKNLPVSESAIYTVSENSKGEMYIANSKAAIYKIRNDSAFAVTGMERTARVISSRNQVIIDLVIDDSANIYFSTLHHSYKFSSKKDTVYDLTELYGQKYSGICYKKIENKYFLIKLDTTTHQKFIRMSYITVLDGHDHVLWQVPYTYLWGERNFIRQRKEGLYFMTTNTIYFISTSGELRKVSFKERLINMEFSPDQRLWVGVLSAGLYELNPQLEITSHYLDGNTVSDILFDNQAGMWVSTIEDGVRYCKNIYDVYYENIPELTDHISLLKKSEGNLYIGTTKGHLFIKKQNVLQHADLKNHYSAINDIINYKGNYLVGTKNGIWQLDTHFNFIKQPDTHFEEEGSMNCYGFSKSERDTLLFISAGVLIKYYGEKGQSRLGLSSMPRTIIQRKKDEFLIGTNLGLFAYDGNAYFRPPYLNDLKDIKISKLKYGREQDIWICTKINGLYRLTVNNKLIRYPNIPSDIVNDISFINENTVLLSTNKGLFINYSGELDTKSAWTLILDNEALAAEEYNNDIYIATKKGLISLSGKYLLKNDNSNFYLESIVADGKKIKPDSINLSYKQNDIYFNFDFLAYQFPDKKLFYQLYGSSSSKGIAKGTQIHLQNLSPGNYTLIVHPLINLSNKRIFKIFFYIKPAFWQTGEFMILVIAVFLIIIFSVAINIIYRIKKREERKAAMNGITAMLSEYRLTALKAQINPHFISNSLAAIQQLITSNEIDSANHYIAKFSLLIRYVLKYSDKSAVRLKHEIEIVDLNVDLEQLRFGHKFIFEKEIDPEVLAKDLYVPPLITQPFIENAIWHGLLPLKGKRTPKLLLKIEIISGKLIISIIDNGVGRKQKEDLNPEHTERESKGVWIIKNRMETLNTLYVTSEARIHFTDLYDGENEPAGTRVDIIFPLSILDKLYDDKNKERYY